jgi:hypothetical protein
MIISLPGTLMRGLDDVNLAYQYKLFLNYKKYTIDNRQYFICTSTFTINGYGITSQKTLKFLTM